MKSTKEEMKEVTPKSLGGFVVLTATLNVRQGPGTNHPVIRQIHGGTVHGFGNQTSANWAHIGGGAGGFVSRDFINNASINLRTQRRVTGTGGANLNIRQWPINGPVVGSLAPGTIRTPNASTTINGVTWFQVAERQWVSGQFFTAV